MVAALDRSARNRRIVAARERGERWARIAVREGVSEREARRAVEQHRHAAERELPVVPLDELHARRLITEVIAQHRHVLDELTTFDPRTTRRYDRGRYSLYRAATYALAAFVSA